MGVKDEPQKAAVVSPFIKSFAGILCMKISGFAMFIFFIAEKPPQMFFLSCFSSVTRRRNLNHGLCRLNWGCGRGRLSAAN